MIVPTGSKIHSSNKDDFSIQIQSVKWEMIMSKGKCIEERSYEKSKLMCLKTMVGEILRRSRLNKETMLT